MSADLRGHRSARCYEIPKKEESSVSRWNVFFYLVQIHNRNRPTGTAWLSVIKKKKKPLSLCIYFKFQFVETLFSEHWVQVCLQVKVVCAHIFRDDVGLHVRVCR